MCYSPAAGQRGQEQHLGRVLGQERRVGREEEAGVTAALALLGAKVLSCRWCSSRPGLPRMNSRIGRVCRLLLLRLYGRTYESLRFAAMVEETRRERIVSVLILDSSAWREYRGVPASLGINPTTHLAKIADPYGRLHDCFVKLLPTNTPALLCEALGWLLAKASGVSCPAFAGIVLVPMEKLRQATDASTVADRSAIAPAWFSEIVCGPSVRQVHTWGFLAAKVDCLRSKDAKKIAAFDRWSDLRDRNLGNVIRSSIGAYVAIDHETLLHDLLWVPTGITWQEHSLYIEARKTLTPSEFLKFQIEMTGASELHGAALASQHSNLINLVNSIIPQGGAATATSIFNLLRQRSGAGWLANDLGVIA